jgi:light-regulated signal transduction histidine kinase (bacteriophytochrome)
VRELVNWISDHAREEDIFYTDHLSALMPSASKFRDRASGVLAVRISKLHRSYVLWFRPEVVQTVRWGGDPNRAKETDGARLHPRQSFELWKEVVRERSKPWQKTEIEAAVDLRNAVVGVVLRKAEEMAELTAQLKRSNRELEAFSYSVSHDLRAPFRHIVGYAELLREREAGQLSEEGQRYVQTIMDSAQFAGMLVDNLLNFSRIARTSMTRLQVDMNELVREVQREVSSEARGRSVNWQIQPLPMVIADPVLMRLAVRNLLSNALKYTRNREQATVQVTSTANDGQHVFCVRDNGIGFDMRYVNKLFGVFQRLHRMEDFEGTGIGLANVRRIVDRHGGRTWAEGEPGKGAAFYFALPTAQPVENERAETHLAS